jgi:hypothetical protein
MAPFPSPDKVLIFEEARFALSSAIGTWGTGYDQLATEHKRVKDGHELTVRRFVHGQTVYQGTAIWRPDTGDWADPVTGEAVPEPTHWKATGRGHL